MSDIVRDGGNILHALTFLGVLGAVTSPLIFVGAQSIAEKAKISPWWTLAGTGLLVAVMSLRGIARMFGRNADTTFVFMSLLVVGAMWVGAVAGQLGSDDHKHPRHDA